MIGMLKFLGCEQLWAVDLTVGKTYDYEVWRGEKVIIDDSDDRVVVFDSRIIYFEEGK